MNLDKIKEIVNSDLPRVFQRKKILETIALDEDALPDIIHIIEFEKVYKDQLIRELNMALSKGLVALEQTKILTDKERQDFISDIKEFYLKWQNRVKCFFKVEGLP